MQKEELQKLLKMLRKNFSKAFPEKSVVPLKKGIDLDICKSDKLIINRTKVRLFLRYYTRNIFYAQTHIEGAKRYDLDGNIVGNVTKDDANSFAIMISEHLKKKKALKEHIQNQL